MLACECRVVVVAILHAVVATAVVLDRGSAQAPLNLLLILPLTLRLGHHGELEAAGLLADDGGHALIDEARGELIDVVIARTEGVGVGPVAKEEIGEVVSCDRVQSRAVLLPVILEIGSVQAGDLLVGQKS